jgi:tagaturonate reductase
MQLRKDNLDKINAVEHLSIPAEYEFGLTEKVLQFGTGVLLRGLPDYFICNANRQKIFNGRIIVIKSTGKGDATVFAKQDNLFVHAFKDVHQYATQKQFFINAAISKVLNAKDEWRKILDCASKKELRIIISNTTEAGIILDKKDNIYLNPPVSFPGKLLTFLFERYKIFNGSYESGMVIIPTELITNNATKLKNILVELASVNKLENNFIEWLINANDFCNSLVDRIVAASHFENNQTIFLHDELSIESEAYGLWAIETVTGKTKDLLSFALANDEVIITNDINKFRALKLALLNATHSFLCGLTLLYNFELVNEAMQNEAFKNVIQSLLKEIVPCVINETISSAEAESFATTVIQRFSNPYIHHKWSAIAVNYNEKIKERCVPLIVKHYTIFSDAPHYMALGFAAYLSYINADVEQALSEFNLQSLPYFADTVMFLKNKIEQHVDLDELISLSKIST